MAKHLALGRAVKSGVSKLVEPSTVEDRLKALEDKIEAMSILFNQVKNALEKKKTASSEQAYRETDTNGYIKSGSKDVNSDGIPINTGFTGVTRGVPYFLKARRDGYYVGSTRYGSLSAAAEGVSKVRRSGWTFWKLKGGKTAKQIFKKR